MTTAKRERIGSWAARCKRGRWFAVDQRTGRQVKARDGEHAAQLAAGNNARELTAAAGSVWK